MRVIVVALLLTVLFGYEFASAQTVTLPAVADAYVQDGIYANTNYGSDATLWVKHDKAANYSREVFFKFDVSSVSSINNARLRIYPTYSGNAGQVHRAALVSNDAWQENSITWSNKPSSSTQLGSDWTVVAGQVVEIDVTAAAQQARSGDGLLSIRIYKPDRGGGSDMVGYASREHSNASARPVLVIGGSGGGTNTPPVAQNDAITTDEDAAVTINVLLNDSDPDGAINPASVTITQAPTNGSTSINTTSGAVVYTPAANFHGTDSFTYTVKDNQGASSNPATVTITVRPLNDKPLFTSTPSTSVGAGQLYSYTVTTSDADGDAVTLSAPTRPSWLSLNSQGSGTAVLEGTPDDGDVGDHPVVLRASDNKGGTTDQSFTIRVTSTGGGTAITLNAIADASVQGGTYANTNFGSDDFLSIKNDKSAKYTRESYLKFDLSSVSNFARARLRIYALYSGNEGQVHRAALVSNDAWQENTITWNNKPSSSTQLGSNWTVVAGQTVEIDVTAAAQQARSGDGLLSIRIYKPDRGGSDDWVSYGSRENTNASVRPVLILDDQPAFTVDDVFIIAGQSNAEGAGNQSLSPVPYPNTAYEYDPVTETFTPLKDPVGDAFTGSAWPAFARKWYELTGRTSAFVEMAVSGTANSARLNSTANWEKGYLLTNAIAAGNELVAKVGGQANVAVLWSQGERDGKAILENKPAGFSKATYKAAFLTTIAAFRNQGWKNFRLVISETGTNEHLGDVGYSDVRAAQREIVEAGEPGVITGFTEAYTFPNRGLMSDDGSGLHYSQAGYNLMGEAMAAALAAEWGYLQVASNLVAMDSTASSSLSKQAVRGDLTGDGYLTSEDVSLLLEYVVSNTAPETGDVLVRGDVSSNGKLTAYDAVLLRQFNAGLIPCLPSHESCSISSVETDGTPGELETGTPKVTQGEIQLPILLKETDESLRSLEIAIRFDSSAVVIKDVTSNVLDSEDLSFHAADGTLRIAMTKTGGIPAGELVTLLLDAHDLSTTLFQGESLVNERSLQTFTWSGADILPSTTALKPNYPNPFDVETRITYQLSEGAEVKMEIFNMLGQRVARLVDAHQEAGNYTVIWKGETDAGVSVSSGMYLCRFQAGSFVQTLSMVLVR